VFDTLWNDLQLKIVCRLTNLNKLRLRIIKFHKEWVLSVYTWPERWRM